MLYLEQLAYLSCHPSSKLWMILFTIRAPLTNSITMTLEIPFHKKISNFVFFFLPSISFIAFIGIFCWHEAYYCVMQLSWDLWDICSRLTCHSFWEILSIELLVWPTYYMLILRYDLSTWSCKLAVFVVMSWFPLQYFVEACIYWVPCYSWIFFL